MYTTRFSDLGVPLQRPPLDRDPSEPEPRWTETPRKETPWTETTWEETTKKEHGTRDRDTPKRNIGPGSQTGSDIIQKPPVDRQTSVKTLPCPKLSLQVVIISNGCDLTSRL